MHAPMSFSLIVDVSIRLLLALLQFIEAGRMPLKPGSATRPLSRFRAGVLAGTGTLCP